METVREFIIKNLKEAAQNAVENVGKKDYKTVFQEKLQAGGNVHIEYRTIKEEGPDHDKKFTVELLVNGKCVSTGIGASKKHAEMQAAQKALEQK